MLRFYWHFWFFVDKPNVNKAKWQIFADDIWNAFPPIKVHAFWSTYIVFKFAPKGVFYIKSVLIQVMVSHGAGHTLLPETTPIPVHLTTKEMIICPLRRRHNGHDGVSNHQLHHCLLKSLFGCRLKKTSKLRVTGLCAGNSPGTGEFPAQMLNNAENVTIWWRHHVRVIISIKTYWCRDVGTQYFVLFCWGS